MLVEAFVPGLRDNPLALLYGRSRAVDPALSDAIHSSTGRKPWTAAQMPDGMRLTFLEDAPREAVLRGLAGDITIVRTDTYASLMQSAEPAARLRIDFHTPAMMRAVWSGKDADRRKYAELLPSLENVLQAAADSWAGPALPAIRWDLVALSWLEVRTRQYRLSFIDPGKSNMVRGLVGYAEYYLDRLDEEQRCAVGALAGFARYRGVGRRTTQGMGVVEVTCGGLETRHAGAQPAAVASPAD